MPREHEWDSRWWSPIINAEHLRMREAAGVIDLSAFQIFDIAGPGALDTVQRTCVAQCDVAVGKVDLHAGARRQGRLPLRPHRDAARRRPLPRRHRRRARPGRPQVVRRPAARRRRDHAHRPDRRGLDDRPVGSAGARHPGLADRRRRVRRGLRLPHLPRDHGRRAPRCSPRGSPTSASSAGSSTSRWTTRPQLWEALLEAGAAHGAVPVGIGVYGTTGRIEKGYRAFGYELDARAHASSRPACSGPRSRPPTSSAARPTSPSARRAVQTVLCTLTVDDHTSASGVKRYMLGGEPILTRDGGTLTDGHGHHPYVTTAGSAPSLGKHLLLAYLPPAEAVDRQRAAVSYMEELYPVTVGSVDATAAARPGQRAASADDQRAGLHQAGRRLVQRGGADRGRAGRRRPVRRLHDERRTRSAPSSSPCRSPRRPAATATVLTLGDADAVEQLRAALAVGCTAAVHVVGRRRRRSARPTSPARSPPWSGHEAEGRPRPGPARQRRRRQRRLPGRHPARLRARPAGRQRRHARVGRRTAR